MWFKHRAWIPIAWVAAFGNLVAVWFAAGEPWHATAHAMLTGLFALGARRLMARQRAETQADTPNEQLQETLDGMQDTIDGMQARVAELEERVDFAERLLAKQPDTRLKL